MSIDNHSVIVDGRSRIGDFEVDTIIGANRKQAFVSIVERKSGVALRQYLPKKMAFDTITEEGVATVAKRLNYRSRKRLNYKTPYEAFY